jgi:hypothetical protein
MEQMDKILMVVSSWENSNIRMDDLQRGTGPDTSRVIFSSMRGSDFFLTN